MKKVNKKSLTDRLIKYKKQLNKSALAPSDILFALLNKHYTSRNKNELKNFEKFNEELIVQLSLLSSDGTDSTLIGKNFNTFYKLFISTMNVNLKLEKLLNENGIEFTLEDELNNGTN